MQGTKAQRGIYTFTVLGSTVLIAYLQALGANRLVDAALTLPVLQPPPTASAPFEPDNSTPPPVPPPRAQPVEKPAPQLVFAHAPACAGFELKITSQTDDPYESRATVRHTGDPSGSLLQQGSVFADMHLIHVGYDAAAVTPVAWFLRGESVCQLRMFSRPPALPTAQAERAALPAEQAPPSEHDDIRSLGPGSFQVDQALVDRLMSAPGATRDAQAAFEKGAGGKYALRFRRIRPGGWAHALGLQVGDLLTSVNGHELKDPRHAIEAYAALRMTKDLVLKLERSGKLETIQIAIR